LCGLSVQFLSGSAWWHPPTPSALTAVVSVVAVSDHPLIQAASIADTVVPDRPAAHEALTTARGTAGTAIVTTVAGIMAAAVAAGTVDAATAGTADAATAGTADAATARIADAATAGTVDAAMAGTAGTVGTVIQPGVSDSTTAMGRGEQGLLTHGPMAARHIAAMGISRISVQHAGQTMTPMHTPYLRAVRLTVRERRRAAQRIDPRASCP
jgi:hypothetical protein